uniref:Uncharacterized protein n=1 Tax=viral metagenome TaxID=1070528 RepID=A0A6C0CLJ9_9ZZZZ
MTEFILRKYNISNTSGVLNDKDSEVSENEFDVTFFSYGKILISKTLRSLPIYYNQMPFMIQLPKLVIDSDIIETVYREPAVRKVYSINLKLNTQNKKQREFIIFCNFLDNRVKYDMFLNKRLWFDDPDMSMEDIDRIFDDTIKTSNGESFINVKLPYRHNTFEITFSSQDESAIHTSKELQKDKPIIGICQLPKVYASKKAAGYNFTLKECYFA